MFEKYEMKYLRRLKLSEIEVVTLKKGMGDLIDDNIPSNIEQQPGTKIIVVESGYIQMTKRADDGGSRVILYFRSGNDGFECIGWRVDQVG